jgi:hypothetical protein
MGRKSRLYEYWNLVVPARLSAYTAGSADSRWPVFSFIDWTLPFYIVFLLWTTHRIYTTKMFKWFVSVRFLCFGSIETSKMAVSVYKRNNRNKHFFSDGTKTSFGSSFGCFDSKLVSLDTLVCTLSTPPSMHGIV